MMRKLSGKEAFFERGTQGRTELQEALRQQWRKGLEAVAIRDLEDFKKDIDDRRIKLASFYESIQRKEETYEQLLREHELSPSPDSQKKLSRQKNSIEKRKTELEKAQPEEFIAGLQAEYDALKEELDREIAHPVEEKLVVSGRCR